MNETITQVLYRNSSKSRQPTESADASDPVMQNETEHLEENEGESLGENLKDV